MTHYDALWRIMTHYDSEALGSAARSAALLSAKQGVKCYCYAALRLFLLMCQSCAMLRQSRLGVKTGRELLFGKTKAGKAWTEMLVFHENIMLWFYYQQFSDFLSSSMTLNCVIGDIS